MNRKQRRAARASAQRPAAVATAKAAAGGTLNEMFAAAQAQHQAGALLEAERLYRQVIGLDPAFAEAHSRLGALLIGRRNFVEAIHHIERALALRPEMFEALGNLAQAYLLIGQTERALEAASRALALHETPQAKTLFAHCLRSMRFTDKRQLPKFAASFVLRALCEGWGGPHTLAAACISLIKLSPIISQWIDRAAASWPARLPAMELLASPLPAALAADKLLVGLLKYDLVADIGFERLLTNVRNALLHGGGEAAPDADLLDLYCALARQCFLNEYIFSLTEPEAQLAAQLRTSLEQALAAEAPCPAWWPIVVGAYFPLHSLANVQALLERSWPASLEALIVQQVKEPAQERQIAATIPALTSIDGEVSRLVRRQYEENPYPRWAVAAPPARSATHSGGRDRDVLIAGCGTGLSTIEFVREARNVRVLAIDLSLASLSYAKRMAQSLGIDNIEFAQADINRIGSIGRTFDFIDASGVLHHLADPWAGWQALLSLLRPGGTMQVSLYSALARQNVLAGRALIAERGYRPVPEDIRRCREAIMAADDGSILKTLTQGDFFTMSECRDMLFHVQEHRLSLPEIRSFIEENDLEFTGFNLDPLVLQRFAERFPVPAARLDLDCWHRFEVEAPTTFLGMYRFWVRKR
jgi:SAM-dependent methyltransferase